MTSPPSTIKTSECFKQYEYIKFHHPLLYIENVQRETMNRGEGGVGGGGVRTHLLPALVI